MATTGGCAPQDVLGAPSWQGQNTTFVQEKHELDQIGENVTGLGPSFTSGV